MYLACLLSMCEALNLYALTVCRVLLKCLLSTLLALLPAEGATAHLPQKFQCCILRFCSVSSFFLLLQLLFFSFGSCKGPRVYGSVGPPEAARSTSGCGKRRDYPVLAPTIQRLCHNLPVIYPYISSSPSPTFLDRQSCHGAPSPVYL